MTTLTESIVEEAALAWLESLGYTVLTGLDVAPGEAGAERSGYDEVVLSERLRTALTRINPQLPPDAIDEAMRRVLRPESPALVQNNRAFHRMLVEGVPVEYRRDDGSITNDIAWLIDYDNPTRNSWLAVNQFSVHEGRHTRRPDIVLFVNGLPLVVFELKNAALENTMVWNAFQQLQTYKQQIPSLFVYNAALVISDGVEARVGSLTANWERFAPWRTIDGHELAPVSMPQLQVLVRGLLEPYRLLEFVRSFIVFEEMGGGTVEKKLAGYHQFHVDGSPSAVAAPAACQPADASIRARSGSSWASGV